MRWDTDVEHVRIVEPCLDNHHELIVFHDRQMCLKSVHGGRCYVLSIGDETIAGVGVGLFPK